MVRLALLDDHSAVLAGLQRLIEPQADMTVLAAAPTVGELSQQLDGNRADVLVLDYDLARGEGLMHCLRVKRGARSPAVIIYSAYAGQGLVLAARAAGADGLVDKAEPVQHLLAAIRGAVAGELAMPRVPRDVYAAAVATLDEADLPVLAMLLDGASLDAMTQALGKSRAEVSWRSQRIVGRLRPEKGTLSSGLVSASAFASRKRPRTLAGGVSYEAAFVLPAGHLLGVVAAHAGGKRPVQRRRPTSVASTHGDPNLLDE